MRRRAIIFDDNDLIRRILWYFFDQRGYEVFTFPEPGLCPLHVAQECPCPHDSSCADLIISDVNMMGTNGIDYIETLLEKGCKQRHFALISASFSEADLVRASKIGCELFTKPLDMEAIQSWVEQVEEQISPERVLYDWIEAN